MKSKVFSFILLFSFLVSQSNAQKTQLTYLALGDSYTIGEAVAENERWPNQLADSLRKRGFVVEKPKIIAKTGWRSDNLIDAIHNNDPTEKYDLVSILIGVNNQYQEKSLEVFKNDLEVLIKLAIKYSKNGREGIFALSIPDYGVTPFASAKNPEKISEEIEAYNNASQAIFEKNGIHFFDICPISKEAKDSPELLAKDQLHPSGLMYQKWVSYLFQKNILYLDALKR
tara:strand:+ start:561 stop:1244 length:684 start_codon:yes stop_codon:yes gene_type:complete